MERIARALKAISHPVRLRMLALIAAHDGEACVCQIQDRFDLRQPTLSHHVRILREAGVIESRQEGTWVHHRIVASVVDEILRLLGSLVPDHQD